MKLKKLELQNKLYKIVLVYYFAIQMLLIYFIDNHYTLMGINLALNCPGLTGKLGEVDNAV